jgi:DNA-binding response OmpR family regulator
MGAAPQITKKILAVDDEQEILLLYNTFLQFKGYEVTAVASAEQCIAHLKKDTPDVILLDVNMPGIDGLRLLEMIKLEPSAHDLPIIMISARGDEATVKAAVKLGCDNFIVKPFKLNELAARIASELFGNATLDVRSLFDHAVFIRTSVFREPGMNEFNSLHWDPYPIKYDEQDLILMLPRGMRPSSLIRLPEAELAQKIVVVYRHPLRWKRLWPKPALNRAS